MGSPHADAAESPPALRRIALDAALSVAPGLRAAFRSGSFAAAQKTSHHDLVTEHDRRVEAELTARLQAAVPGSAVLGEEHGLVPHAGVEPSPVTWIVDPIDGTSNFTHGFTLFSVSIAAAVHGEVVAAAVVAPAEGLAFSSDDAGAYLSDGTGGTRRLGPGAPAPAGPPQDPAAARPESALNLVTSYPAGEALRTEGAAALERFGELVECYATVRRVVSGALELCWAAAGWADVVLGVDTRPWDVAAGHHILLAAGGGYAGLGPDGVPVRPAHEGRWYLGTAPGVRAPTAERVLQGVLADRRAPASPTGAGRRTRSTMEARTAQPGAADVEER